MKVKQASTLLIYCGGTIGMMDSADGYRPEYGFSKLIIDKLTEHAINNIDIVSMDPLIDSALAEPKDWLAIIRVIARYAEQYDGFVVLHGTDTLAYTAAALSLWLDALDKPVIITGAQRPFVCQDSDGLANVLGALHYARLFAFRQVGVYFGGVLLNPRATRKVHAQADRAFASPNAKLWGEMVNGEYHYYLSSRKSTAIMAPLSLLASLQPQHLNKVVVLCHLTPGISPTLIQAAFAQDVSAIVLLSYGVGNIPAQPVLHTSLRQALARGATIINCTQCYQGHTEQDTYAAGMGRFGVIEGGAITYEFAYVVAYFAAVLKWTEADTKRFLNSSDE